MAGNVSELTHPSDAALIRQMFKLSYDLRLYAYITATTTTATALLLFRSLKVLDKYWQRCASLLSVFIFPGGPHSKGHGGDHRWTESRQSPSTWTQVQKNTTRHIFMPCLSVKMLTKSLLLLLFCPEVDVFHVSQQGVWLHWQSLPKDQALA